MKTITKYFATLTAGERYQNALYERYDYVRLVRSPFFGVDGYYTWEVKR